MNTTELFQRHVENFDLSRVFEVGGKTCATRRLEIQEIGVKLFGPYIARMFAEACWIKNDWQCSSINGFKWQPADNSLPNFDKARSPLELASMFVEFQALPCGIYKAMTQLFSNSDGHWNVGRGGNGIKSMLKSDNWKGIEADPELYVGNINRALEIIAAFNPETDANVYWIQQGEVNSWRNLPDTTVPFHLVWPQFFPVWYRSSEDGSYSQIEGMNKLLDEIANTIGLTRKSLNLSGNYGDYASAYRVILLSYHYFIQSDLTLPVPHFDFLTQLLAELDPKTEAVKQFLTRKALILYGTPGTGKTYAAEKEISPAIALPANIKVIQFHPGYSYADFIIGIRPKSVSGKVTYPVVPGILYRIAAEAAAHNEAYLNAIKKIDDAACVPGNSEEIDTLSEPATPTDFLKSLRYVLIIDEINRADLSRVLGEALYVLENRGANKSIALPNRLDEKEPENVISVFDGTTSIADPFVGGAKFYLPDNLFIIGTMNHVDRSISGFDMALRRRFSWVKHKFSTTKLREILQKNTNGYVWMIANTESFVARCQALNDLIKWGGGTEKRQGELPFNQDHILGHTFFAEIVGIFKQDLPALQGSDNPPLKIAPHHMEKLWLYSLKPQLEDTLGYEAAAYTKQMTNLRREFTKSL